MQLFLATHGRMASGMLSSIEILYGTKPKNLTVFDAYVDEKKLSDEVNQFINKTNQNEIKVLMSDIYGGSVCQELIKYIEYENTFVITGTNLGILLSLLTWNGEITKEELNDIICENKKLTCIIDQKELQSNEEYDDIFD